MRRIREGASASLLFFHATKLGQILFHVVPNGLWCEHVCFRNQKLVIVLIQQLAQLTNRFEGLQLYEVTSAAYALF